jgi:hypothetical protein
MLLIKPQVFINQVTPIADNHKLYIVAIGVRLLLAIALIMTAPISKFPLTFSALGYLTLFAVVVLILMGHSRFKRLISWALTWAPKFSWVSGAFILPFGLFLIYAVAH